MELGAKGREEVDRVFRNCVKYAEKGYHKASGFEKRSRGRLLIEFPK